MANLRRQRNREPNRISDETVRAKTGKSWSEWFSILDAASKESMSHRQLVAYLGENFDVGPWWRQMVAVTYEQSRGLREKHQKPSGFEIARSRTLEVPVTALYRAWLDPRFRQRWLSGESLTIRKVNENRSLRFTWSDGESILEVRFYAKGKDKSQVTVQHSKISDAAEAERMKAYWAESLERLKGLVTEL